MNQILDFGENKEEELVQETLPKTNKTMEDYYQKPETSNQPPMNFSNDDKNKNSMKIFAIALAIFAIVSIFIAVGIFLITRDKKNKIPQVSNELPQILMVENEETIEVTATYKGTLERLIYTWGENPDQTIPGEGKNSISTSIAKPIGTYMLKIKVVAQDGNEAFEEKEFTQEQGPDLEKPRIDFQVTDSKKLKITVRDNVGIETFKYYWNDDEPTELTEATGRTEASVEVEIQKGRNKITVIAIDEAGLQTIEAKEYTGKELPTVLLHVTADRKYVIVTASHEKGITEIVTNLNGKETKKTYEGDLIKEEVKLQILLQPGSNIVEVKALSADGEEAVIKGSAEAPGGTQQQVQQTQPQPQTQTQ